MVSRKEQIDQLLAAQNEKRVDSEELLERIQQVLEEGLPDMDWRDRASLGYDVFYVVSRWAHKDDPLSE